MMALTVDIRKRLGSFSLDVAFTARGGEVTGLLGASGCGKSLTLKCVAGIERPDEAASSWTAGSSSTLPPASTCPPRSGRWAICSKAMPSSPI